ncbi:uncharacterized protein C1orf167 homolog isoform X4 [Equus przewalskii]|uniref:Uncharacterized protein C1orf167 homolog isoform X4 n=1 Tax=Equus przewalskii TaxID=9798 RepID=A0ABM4NPL6_EQUPR
MELRPDTSHKENVAPRPATPTRPGKRLSGSGSEVAGPQAPPALIAAPITSSFKQGTRQSSLAPLSSASTSTAEQRRLRKSLGVGLGSGHGQWVPMCQAKRGGPAATPSPGAVLCQEPCRVQTNLASPSPGLGLALKDTTGQLINSGFWQQSNLQRLARRPQRRAPRFAVQQSNLSMKEATLAECGSHTSPQSEPQESVWPHMMPQLAAAVQVFPSLAARGADAAGSGGGAGAGPPAAVAQGPTGAAVGTMAPGGPAGGGVGATHAGPAGPELPKVEKPDLAAETRAAPRPSWARTPILWGRPGPRPRGKEASAGPRRGSSFLQGMRRRMLQRILRRWRLRAWGPGTPSGSTRTPSAPEPLGGIPGWEASLGCSTQGSSLEEASRAPALLESLGGSLPWAAGRQQGRCQQPRGAVRWHQSPLQRRILLGWSRWAAAQGAQRELAVRWAWARSCRATLGLWRRRLAQWQEAEQWARERGRRRVREALCRWRSRWQRQQFLHQKYQRWVQVHLQGLRRAVFQGWQQATARRRHMVAEPEQLLLQSHFQAWCGVVRDTGVLQAKCRAFQDGLRRRALRAAFVTWQESRVAAAWAQEQRVTRASIAQWRRCAQGGRADRQLRKAQAHQAFTSWRVALDQRREARQQAEEGARAQAWVALCWTLWVRESRLHRLSRAHAARKLSARVLEAWARSAAQGRVQRATISQFQQAGPRHLLRTHWAQWQTALLRVRLEPPSRAREASTAHPRPRSDLRHWPSLASRGCLLVVIDAAAPWQQTHSCSPQATGPMLPGSTQHHSLCRQSKPREMAWAQSKETCPWGHMSEVQGDREPPLCHSFQLWLHWPGHSSWTPNRLPTGPGGGCSSETGTLKGKGEADNQRRLGRKYLQRWQLEALLRRLQGTQQARRLAVTWQRWVDAQGAEQLARTLLLQWHLRWAWRTWRRWVLRLRVAQRLQQQGDGWVLSQAFEKWQQHLAARDLMRGATGSLRPLSKPAIRSPGSRLEAAQAPECAGLGAEQGAQLQL